MSTYFTLDEALIDAIKAARRTFTEIRADRAVREESQRLEREGLGEDWRIVDRRLQALRKAGRIFNTRHSKKNPDGGWNLAKSTIDGGGNA